MKRTNLVVQLFGLLVLLVASIGFAGTAKATIITEFTSLSAYNTAVGAHTVIDFQGFSSGTVITTQFSGLGATFTDGNDTILTDSGFVTDGIGLKGNGRIDMSFSFLISHVGAEFPGALQIDLFLGTTLVDTSSQFAEFGTGFFGGVLSTPIDRVVLRDWLDDTVFIDNLHFNRTVVPEPSSLLLLASGLAGLAGWRWRQARLTNAS